MGRMAPSERLRRPVAAVAVAAAAGSIVWAMSADAGPSREPAAFARHALLRISHARTLNGLGSPRASLIGSELVAGGGTRRIHLGGGGDEAIAALTGSLVPVAVQSQDGSLVAYSSWHQIAQIKPDEPGQGLQAGDPIGIPSVRLYDAQTGKDSLVATGAYSPALSPTGELAFVKGDGNVVREGVDYVGRVVVGSAREKSFARWTSDEARYFPYAWAGETLLVYRTPPESETTDLYAFTGPGSSRLVAAAASVVALSPDGTRVLITVGRRMVEIVRIADGAVEASLALDGPGVAEPGSNSTPHALMYSGSWFGDRIVADSDAGLVVLNVNNGIHMESVFETPFPHGVIEPTFTDDSHIIGWTDVTSVAVGKKSEPAYNDALVTCDLSARSCVSGPVEPARAWTRWVTNPSR